MAIRSVSVPGQVSRQASCMSAIGVIHTGQGDDITSAAQSINVKTNGVLLRSRVGVNIGTLRPYLSWGL